MWRRWPGTHPRTNIFIWFQKPEDIRPEFVRLGLFRFVKKKWSVEIVERCEFVNHKLDNFSEGEREFWNVLIGRDGRLFTEIEQNEANASGEQSKIYDSAMLLPLGWSNKHIQPDVGKRRQISAVHLSRCEVWMRWTFLR